MLRKKVRDFQSRWVCLESLVPEDNFYRKVEATIDLSAVRDLVRDQYGLFSESISSDCYEKNYVALPCAVAIFTRKWDTGEPLQILVMKHDKWNK